MERAIRTVVVKDGEIEDDGFDDESGLVRLVVEVFCRTEDEYCNCIECASFSQEDEAALVAVLSRYPSLSELCIHNGNRFGARALANIIRCHTQLTKIKIHGKISLIGTQEEFCHLGSVIQAGLSQLEECQLTVSTTSSSFKTPADGLVRILSSIPSMRTLVFLPQFRRDNRLESMVSTPSLVAACLSTNLRAICICPVPEDIAIRVMQALERNFVVEQFFTKSTDGWTASGGKAIAQLIQMNRSLEVLGLFSTRNENVLHALRLSSRALVSSPLINHFIFQCPLDFERNSLVRDAVIGLLQTNTVLTRFSLGWSESDRNSTFLNDIHFFLKLNRAGRGRLDSKSSKSHCIDVIGSVCDDVSCIFYFLSNNPTLFQLTDPVRRSCLDAERTHNKRRRLYRSAKYSNIERYS